MRLNVARIWSDPAAQENSRQARGVGFTF